MSVTGPLNAGPPRSGMHLPHPALRPYVDAYHGYRYTRPMPDIHHGLPGTALTAVIAIGEPIDIGWLGLPASRARHWAMVSGLGLAPAAIYQNGWQEGVTLELTPLGARAMFGMPAAELTSEMVALDDLVGPRTGPLLEAVAAATDWPARFAAIDSWLLGLAAGHERRAGREPTLERAWARLHMSSGRIAIAVLADEVGWSRRRLTQRFTEEYGLAPKQVARVVRFNAARERLAAGVRSLASLAAECGYADQAHLTREWRALAGLTPTAWVREERPFLQDVVDAR